MRWTRGNRGNIEDMRGGGGRTASLGIGGFILLLLLSWATGTDFLSLFQGASPTQNTGTTGPAASTPEEEQLVDFVDAVTADAQRTWSELLGGRYQPTSVVLFRDAIQSACGIGESATGPFYCPGDRRVYLDLGFFGELARQFGAPGDFSQAYVIAHEIGHHVQNLLDLGVGQPRSRARKDRRSRSNCRLIASPASGDTRRHNREILRSGAWSSNRATPRRRCAPPHPSATIGFRRCQPAA